MIMEKEKKLPSNGEKKELLSYEKQKAVLDHLETTGKALRLSSMIRLTRLRLTAKGGKEE